MVSQQVGGQSHPFAAFQWLWDAIRATVFIFGIFFLAVFFSGMSPTLGRFLALHPVDSSIGFKAAFWILLGVICVLILAKHFLDWMGHHPKFERIYYVTLFSFLTIFMLTCVFISYQSEHSGKVTASNSSSVQKIMLSPDPFPDRVLLHFPTQYTKQIAMSMNIVGSAKVTDMGHGRYLVQMGRS